MLRTTQSHSHVHRSPTTHCMLQHKIWVTVFRSIGGNGGGYFCHSKSLKRDSLFKSSCVGYSLSNSNISHKAALLKPTPVCAREPANAQSPATVSARCFCRSPESCHSQCPVLLSLTRSFYSCYLSYCSIMTCPKQVWCPFKETASRYANVKWTYYAFPFCPFPLACCIAFPFFH